MRLYHGTCAKNLKGIRERGLCPSQVTGNRMWEGISNPGSIYLSDSQDVAYFWGEEGAQNSLDRDCGSVRILAVDAKSLDAKNFKIERLRLDDFSEEFYPDSKEYAITPRGGCIPPEIIRLRDGERWEKLR